jgi:hypothetical protein
VKKILLGIVLMGTPFFPVNMPEKIDAIRERIESKVRATFGIYKDEAFSQEEVNFSPGQKVFVKVSGVGEGTEATITLQDENKTKIFELNMDRNGADYTGRLNVGEKEGIYYIHIEITGEGVSFVGERNINVGGASGQTVSNASVEAVSISDTSSNGLHQNTIVTASAMGFIGWLKNWIYRILGLFHAGS